MYKLYRKGTQELVDKAKAEGKSRRYIKALGKHNKLKVKNRSLNQTNETPINLEDNVK